MTLEYPALSVVSGLISYGIFRTREQTHFLFLPALLFALPHTLSWFSPSVHCFSTSLLAYLSTVAVCTVGYRLSPQHPLASFPGPVLARTTKWWCIYHMLFSTGRPMTFESLHRRYGPWVRVGPNELSVNLKEAIRPIYQNLDRSRAYLGTPADADTLITIIDRKQHSHRRRPWIKSLSGSSLQNRLSHSYTRTREFVHTLHIKAPAEDATDIGHWFSLLLLDTIGDMAFSGGFETMKAGKDTTCLLDMLNKGATVVGVLNQIPWARKIVEAFPQPGPITNFFKFAKGKVNNAKAVSLQSGASGNILSDILAQSQTLTEGEAAADACLLIASSVETTSQALITLVRHVYKNPRILQRLRSEIQTSFLDMTEDNDSDLKSLPYLKACIQEALRILPPFPAGPPRTTGSNDTVICNRLVPRDTTVHIPVWSLHHSEENFKDASCFIPERWLPDNEPPILPHVQEAFIPFSVGHGACPGRQLALHNIRIIFSHFVAAFDVVFQSEAAVSAFDNSYKECGLWKHEPLLVELVSRLGS